MCGQHPSGRPADEVQDPRPAQPSGGLRTEVSPIKDYRHLTLLDLIFFTFSNILNILTCVGSRRGHDILKDQLPSKEEHVILVRLSPLQRALYTEFMNRFREAGNSGWLSLNPLKAFAVCCKVRGGGRMGVEQNTTWIRPLFNIYGLASFNRSPFISILFSRFIYLLLLYFHFIFFHFLFKLFIWLLSFVNIH